MDFREVELHVESSDQLERHGEPVTCGIPWPRGVLREGENLCLRDAAGRPVPLQTRVLDRWPDGSVRWLLLDWMADFPTGTPYRLGLADVPLEIPTPPLQLKRVPQPLSPPDFTVDTGAATFGLFQEGPFIINPVVEGRPLPKIQAALMAVNDQDQPVRACVDGLVIEEQGLLRSTILLEGNLIGSDRFCNLPFTARLHFFAGSPTLRIAFILKNHRKAEHPGGLWDLGNGGSTYLKDLSFAMIMLKEANRPGEELVTGCPGSEDVQVRFSPESSRAFVSAHSNLEIYQDSSGGPNWQSCNHLNRNHVVPNTFSGYRVRVPGQEQTGRRATPVVHLSHEGQFVATAMRAFWQNFPKAITASRFGLHLHLFPSQYADVHELQGGEQKTHEFYAAFGRDKVTEEPLAWARSPLFAHATPEWYCAAGVVPYLTPRSADPNTEYLKLVDAAIEGDDTFDHKREVVDEYGWRHFGDIYGDHEAVFHKGPQPLVSHYNNQYDAIAGFAYQFLRSGDRRWFRHMDELAAHVIDIDIYHTDQDKAAYNHGLFWHTFHYVDADTGTHRSYPRAAKVCGGGPANEQNYTTGLMLHHFLTGSQASRDAALELARWVIAMDDGKKTIFRWLAGGNTGLASSSRTPFYHGPGRGAANSIAALLDGHRLTGEAGFLDKAEQLIRRCIHPADDVPARNLLDAENRWFYIMFLQVLGRYLDYKAERGELDFLYAYAQASLLHYARWMAENEYPYLEKPERLEYPTETWAAQDMRKSEVFKYAARHADGEERERFLERSEFFFRYSTRTLAGMKTRTLARPVVLLLSFGFMHAAFGLQRIVPAPRPAREDHDFGRPTVFVPQKVRALKRLKMLAAASAVGFLAMLAGLAFLIWR